MKGFVFPLCKSNSISKKSTLLSLHSAVTLRPSFLNTEMTALRALHAEIARSLELEDRIECMALKPAFITLKDHKEDWPRKITCRVINPTKTHIGSVSKKILDRVNDNGKAAMMYSLGLPV